MFLKHVSYLFGLGYRFFERDGRLTCDFAEEIRERDVKGKRKAKAKAKTINQSFRLRLHSGLRQSGDAFGVAFIRRAEALRFRSECVGPG
jgi:hypothetical protein